MARALFYATCQAAMRVEELVLGVAAEAIAPAARHHKPVLLTPEEIRRMYPS